MHRDKEVKSSKLSYLEKTDFRFKLKNCKLRLKIELLRKVTLLTFELKLKSGVQEIDDQEIEI